MVNHIILPEHQTLAMTMCILTYIWACSFERTWSYNGTWWLQRI